MWGNCEISYRNDKRLVKLFISINSNNVSFKLLHGLLSSICWFFSCNIHFHLFTIYSLFLSLSCKSFNSIHKNVCLGLFHPLNYSNIDITHLANGRMERFPSAALPLFYSTFVFFSSRCMILTTRDSFHAFTFGWESITDMLRTRECFLTNARG